MTVTADDLERRYEYVLTTMSAQALSELHAGALHSLSVEHRTEILRALQEGLGTGSRVTAENTSALGRLVAHGSRAMPHQFATACRPDARRALLEAVVAHVGPRHWDRYPAWTPPPKDVGTSSAELAANTADYSGEARALAASHVRAANATGTF